MTRKLFALASITALTGAVAVGTAAGCSDSEVAPVEVDASTGKRDSGRIPLEDASDEPPCLDETPIDATKFPYAKANTPVKGACTTKDSAVLGDYYRAKSSEPGFTATAWAASVPETCAKCAFTFEGDAAPAASWGAIIIKGDKVDDVNVGGCIEVVSGKESCGRAYQQYQACLAEACLSKCTTNTGYQACRSDTRVLDTACKSAADTVRKECGSSAPSYESQCKGTTYTFEGPVKVLCITPPDRDAGAITDAGSDADAEAGIP